MAYWLVSRTSGAAIRDCFLEGKVMNLYLNFFKTDFFLDFLEIVKYMWVNT